MKAGRFTSWVVVLASILLSGCLLPGMIPLNPTPEGPLPVMETDSEALLAKIQAGDWVYLESLAEEEYLRAMKENGCKCILMERDQHPEEHVVFIGAKG